MKEIIVTYDISNDRRRYKIAKELLRFGIRTQKSLFECSVNSKELSIIKKVLLKFSEPDDLITVYEVKKDAIRVGNTQYIEVDDLVF